MGKANVVFKLGYVQNERTLAKNKVLKDRYGEKRAFYSCNKTDADYLGYVEKGSKEATSYVDYSGDNEKSLGIFNQNGLMKQKDKAALRKSLRKTESVIWFGLISFEEMFGKRYIPDCEDAYRLMKIEFPRFLKNAGFDPEKIEWFAGLHENTLYRHIHYSFYEKEPSRYSAHKSGLHFAKGPLSNRAFERFKICIEQRLTDISSEIKIARKEILDITKNLLFSPQSTLRYQTDIQERLDKLLTAMPACGRTSYDSENMKPLKPLVNKIIDGLIKINKPLYEKFNGFSKRANQKDTDTLKMLKASKIDEAEWGGYLVADKYLTDLYRRLGNQIIASVKGIKGNERTTQNRLANKRIRRRTLKSLISYALKLNSDFERDAAEALSEFMRKLDRVKEKNQEENYQYEME